MRNKTIKILGALIALILVFTVAIPIVNAEDETTGSLTIVKYEVNSSKSTTDNASTYVENINGSGKSGFLLSGVTFAIYKISDDSESTEIPDGATAYATGETGDNGTGIVTFSNLPLGRYLVVEVSAPDNVVSKIANFIVDIPMTSSDGESLVYDVTVYPKNNTVYGGVTLTKYGNDNTEPLTGVGFELQKEGDGGSWTKYNTADLATDENGQIIVEGLPAGKYRFVETSTLTGYILDNNTTYEFTVSLNETDGTTTVSPSTIDVYNQKPTITKEVTTTSTSYKKGDTISFEVTADIPDTIASLNTYTITDSIPTGLTYTDGSAKVYVDGVEMTTGYTLEVTSGTIMTVTFTNASLSGKEELSITYDTTLNSSADATTAGNTNTAILTYSTIVSTDYSGSSNTDKTSSVEDSATVYTGGFYIKKINKSGDTLQGAVFKLASSEENAKNGVYLSDENGAITLTTGQDGLAQYKGLAYGTYYLVEVQAPSYEEGGETKYYNLLTSPVAITVGADTYSESVAEEIINKTGFTLPVTGGIGTVIIIIAGIGLVGAGVVIYKKGGNK